MNELIVPPSPQWYNSSIFACAADETLIYGSKHNVVVIENGNLQDPNNFKIFSTGYATKFITSISVNKKWGNPYKYIATLTEDNSVKIWDLNSIDKTASPTSTAEFKEPLVSIVFAGDDRIVGATSSGLVHIWNIHTDEKKRLANLFNFKVDVTCISSCPHASWLIAFGLNNGCVIVADLRRDGKVIYRLRGHQQAVISLSWCPAPVNVFPRDVHNTVRNKPYPEEIAAKSKNTKANLWTNLVHADDGEHPEEETEKRQEEVSDFLKECAALKNKILNVEEKSESVEEKSSVSTPRKFANRRKKNKEIEQNRDLPQIYDPSDDFAGNITISNEDSKEEIIEDKDTDTEKDLGGAGDAPQSDKDDNLHDESCSEAEEPVVEDKTECVNPPEAVEEDPRSEYLLASSGRDRWVYIWRAGTDGRMQTSFQVPRKSKSRDPRNNCWITACWVSPETILTSSLTGDLLAWSLPKPKNSDKLHKSLHYEHSSTIFNIVTAPKVFTEHNWKNNSDSASIWTYGQEGLLIRCDFKTGKVDYCCPALSIVVSMDAALFDPNRIVFGHKDATVRVWDVSKPNTDRIVMQKFHQKITGKVTAVSWHPTKEMVLAFGNDEGVVGTIDCNSKKTTLLSKYFHTTIYKVEWGPIAGDKENLGVYVVSDGKIVIYDTEKSSKEPTLLDLGSKLFIYKFSWKPDYNCLLINIIDGSIIILKSDLTLLTTIYFNDKNICLSVWHPDAAGGDTERSNWFAAPTNKGFLIYNCDMAIDHAENYSQNVIGTFEGHIKAPTCLAWNPFDALQILSSSPDGLTHIWNVSDNTILSSFCDPTISLSPMAMWSPLDADLVILVERYVRIWRISANPPKSKEFIAERKSFLEKHSPSENKSKLNKIKVEIAANSNKKVKSNIIPPVYASSEEGFEEQVEVMRNLLEGKSEGNEMDPIKLFGGKEDILQLLTLNYDINKQASRSSACETIALWKGNLAECIREQINENRVTPTAISLAPMVSTKLWQEACAVYAQKLAEDSTANPITTATYFLACHKVEEALNCLCDGQMYREALALAKCRLPEDSPIIGNVMEKWIGHCIQTGNFEMATLCYISIKDYEKAAKTLSRRNNAVFLGFALELAEKAENKELCEFIKFKIEENRKETEKPVELPSRADAFLQQKTEIEKNDCKDLVDSEKTDLLKEEKEE